MSHKQKKLEAFMDALNAFVDAKISESKSDSDESGIYSSYKDREALSEALNELLEFEA